jgi:hypothetical protein
MHALNRTHVAAEAAATRREIMAEHADAHSVPWFCERAHKPVLAVREGLVADCRGASLPVLSSNNLSDPPK